MRFEVGGPFSARVNNSKYLDPFFAGTISFYERCTRNYQLSGLWHPPDPPKIREFLQALDSKKDRGENSLPCWEIIIGDVVEGGLQMTDRKFAPDYVHFRCQCEAIFFTLACSTTLPASASRIPDFICSMCHC